MASIFEELLLDRQAVIDAVLETIQTVPGGRDYAQDIRRIEEDLSSIAAKKDRLLEMSIEGVITMAEFKQRNDGFNKQAQGLEESLTALRAEMEKEQQTTARAEDIRRVLEQELSFQNGIDSALVTTILDKIVVKKGSTREKLYLDIYLKFGSPLGIVLDREKSSFCVNRS